jgi:hypothetical protein
VIFTSVDRAHAAYESGSVAGTLLIFVVALTLAGAVVGAVHGLALLRLTGNAQTSSETEMAKDHGHPQSPPFAAGRTSRHAFV